MSEAGSKSDAPVLVCFALKDEAKHFLPAKNRDDFKVLITGIGGKNTEATFRPALASAKPRLVVTCGYAGGLDPALPLSAIVFEADAEAGLTPRLLKLGARAVRFFCADRIATTAAEKKMLREATGADAVEMESAVIRQICREQKIPAATIRVISDVAGEDMPLDFNQLTTPDLRLDYFKLGGKVLANPGKIPRLIRFGRQTAAAAKELGRVLSALLLDSRN